MILTYANDFWHKIKIYNFDIYDVFLAIAKNIPMRYTNVVQSHIWGIFIKKESTVIYFGYVINTVNRTFKYFPLKQAYIFLNLFSCSYSRTLIYSTFSFHNAFYCPPDLQCLSYLFYSDGSSTNIALETYWKMNAELIKSSFDQTRVTTHKPCRSLRSYIPLYQILLTRQHIQNLIISWK